MPVSGLAVARDADTTDCLASGAELVSGTESIALLVMGDGTACRTEKAPGYLDPRAEAYDTGAALALGTPAAGARPAHTRPFGRYGSPSRRLDALTLYVDPLGRGDHTDVASAVEAASGCGIQVPCNIGNDAGEVCPRDARSHGECKHEQRDDRLHCAPLE